MVKPDTPSWCVQVAVCVVLADPDSATLPLTPLEDLSLTLDTQADFLPFSLYYKEHSALAEPGPYQPPPKPGAEHIRSVAGAVCEAETNYLDNMSSD